MRKFSIIGIFALILISGCPVTGQLTTPDLSADPVCRQIPYDSEERKTVYYEEPYQTSECSGIPMKYNQDDGTIYFRCGGVWIGSEEYQKGLDWKYDCSLTIRNMETEESGSWTVVFKLETWDGVEELERSQYIYPGESYTFEVSFIIKDPYEGCETECMPNQRYEIIAPQKTVCKDITKYRSASKQECYPVIKYREVCD